MTESENSLLKYYESEVSDCFKSSDGICINIEKGKCKCIDGQILEQLKELEQYRAIGTPTKIYEKIGGLDVELGKYRLIGTVEELKASRNASELWEHNNNLAYKQGRIDAVDEFVEECKKFGFGEYALCCIKSIAEQMKGGATDES